MFICKNHDCKQLHESEEEDATLTVVVEETHVKKFKIDVDGNLEFRDSDYDGQQIHLECEMCGAEYELDADYFEIKKSYSFPFSQKELKKKKLIERNKLWG